MKYLLIIGDGMGDEPLAELGGQTPLAAARTETLDRLARAGNHILVQTVPDGFPPGSDVANLSLLGYDPRQCYTGRAPLEAAAMGVKIGEDELAFRCNLVTLEFQGGRVIMRDYSGGHISTGESHQLISALQQECGSERLRLYPGVSYRHLLLVRGEVPDCSTVPPHDHLDQDVTQAYRCYLGWKPFADLMEKARHVLENHPVNRKRIQQGRRPANGIWLWGEGKSPEMQTLSQRYGLHGGVLVSAVDLLKGIGVYAGLAVPDITGATGYIDTNYQGKVEAALDGLRTGDLAVVHLEGADEAGHQGKLADKIQAIEDLDQRVVAPLVRHLEKGGEDFRLAVGMDHYTPLALRTHVDWPVPVMVYDSREKRPASGLVYSEANTTSWAQARRLEFDGPGFFRYFLDADVQ